MQDQVNTEANWWGSQYDKSSYYKSMVAEHYESYFEHSFIQRKYFHTKHHILGDYIVPTLLDLLHLQFFPLSITVQEKET